MSRLKQIEAGGSHLEVGFAIGKRFGDQIHRALDRYPFFQERILPYHRRPEGQALYRELLALHRARYPDYVAELEGLAQGAGRPFEDLFLVNLRGEYAGYLGGPADGCFDCALAADGVTLIGHNEDGAPAFEGNVYLIRAQVKGKPAFTVVAYPGFLPGNAFGFNDEGICFSVDDVVPQEIKVGVGRHFLARSLLEARSLDEAIARVTAPGRAAGFGYTIGAASRVVQVEVAPETHQVREVRGCYVHANHYRELDGVAQIIEPSSAARVARAEAILEEKAPVDADGVLAILGDEADERYPIYRTASPPDELATLCTALFDLEARWLRIYTGHPTRDPGRFVDFNLPPLRTGAASVYSILPER